MKTGRFIGCGTLLVLVALGGFLWWRYFFVFGEGVKAGDLNYLVKKGYVFKTWEGRLIQTGFRAPAPGSMQSNEFEFSVSSDTLARRLEQASGRFVELRYKEYLHSLPWRGMSRYVVTEVVRITDEKDSSPLPYRQ